MLNRTRIARAAALLTLAVVLGSGMPAAKADTRANTGLVGIAPGQSARLNAVHTGDETSRDVRVHLAILDAAGAVLAETEAVLRPGQSASVELAAPPTGGTAMLSQGRVRVSSGSYATGRPDSSESEVMGTFEIVNPQTGETALLLPAINAAREAGRR
jgi:hypothetical protein